MNGSKISGGDEGSIRELDINRFYFSYMRKKGHGGAHMVYGPDV